MPAQLTIKSLADINRMAALIDARMKFLYDASARGNTDFSSKEKHDMQQEYLELERLRREF